MVLVDREGQLSTVLRRMRVFSAMDQPTSVSDSESSALTGQQILGVEASTAELVSPSLDRG